MSQIVLFDLPSKDRCACWSYNPWKTRLSLNFKNLDYETEWIEYPDIAPKFKSFGIPENKSGTKYTIPAVRLTDGTYLMDSLPIAKALEKEYPTPSLHLDWETLPKVFEKTTQILDITTPWWKAKIPRNVLLPRSAEYFSRTRAERHGMPLEQLESDFATEQVWSQVKPVAEQLGAILKASGGPYYMGSYPSYADFVTVGALQCLKRADEIVFQKLVGLEPELLKLYDACREWLERDDH
ncbi:hypothetical protein, variant [Verruconis gallopava]|uniref:Uncharacterized protein n=1 Tax=Verruconis gallopava TaxID=253628 RepID=A0A0D2ARU6_9PEZI|nr:uncharacterized protein PV09_06746 [Verruconis gallopava]XP_016211774.1 hypothetical protein, variant [Verruconis gallopava]KIW01904.1 hypothetical protein PV09_06746 [Verruconis gallopava]KIW01905.1 hypothetical protein, variant [Verruconis gallopava]